MGHDRKARMFQLLLDMGFKEIEVGFPSASQTDFDFARWCVEEGEVPDDVDLQVLVQCRPELIQRTFESLEGAKTPIVHFYNSTSELQRRVVFEKDVAGIKRIATDAAKMITDMAAKAAREPGHRGYRFQYSPESFTGTELEVALEICNAVAEIVRPTPENRLIVNLPSTVEMATPNTYADRIEWMCRNLDNRENLIISLHPHNDRGTGIATTELGLMAGADRVEGTLFGNGERTGNVDIVTLALNMYTQGVDPMLDCSDITRMKDIYEYSNQLRIPERHPYVGELVYTAFSGSHQDAINKGMKAAQKANNTLWEVPYLPIDPKDVGRSYEAIIRINSQSGKGGIAYILQADYGLNLPRGLQVEFSQAIQAITDGEGKELPSTRIHDEFLKQYVDQPGARLKFVEHRSFPTQIRGQRIVEATVVDGGREMTISGTGTGPIDGFVDALSRHVGIPLSVLDYSEHSMQRGSNAAAISYMEVEYPGGRIFGAGINTNISAASLEAVVSAVNRILSRNQN
jgi:2-isopropylmalate synthase